jgi:two-component system chemotaxis response regulator CheY
MRVLIADDQEPVRVVLDHLLTEAGHEVVAAAGDGREAYLRTRELRPDAVILDVGMPNLDGIATLRLIRESDPDLRIVVHTGYDDDQLSAELHAAGCDAVVVKSANPASLLRALTTPVQV